MSALFTILGLITLVCLGIILWARHEIRLCDLELEHAQQLRDQTQRAYALGYDQGSADAAKPTIIRPRTFAGRN